MKTVGKAAGPAAKEIISVRYQSLLGFLQSADKGQLVKVYLEAGFLLLLIHQFLIHYF